MTSRTRCRSGTAEDALLSSNRFADERPQPFELGSDAFPKSRLWGPVQETSGAVNGARGSPDVARLVGSLVDTQGPSYELAHYLDKGIDGDGAATSDVHRLPRAE